MKIVLAGIEREGIVKLTIDGTITSVDFSADGKNPLEGVVGPAWAGWRSRSTGCSRRSGRSLIC